MFSIGDKIRTLRKNKNITQEQLADALAVSAQSISKWENNRSVPDISILPVIARFFGVTMDDLFQFRLDALHYKERFVRFMVDNGMLRFGEFRLKSGRISPYLVHSGYYRTGSQISKLGEFYAACIREHAIESNRLIGLTNREIPLVISTGMILYSQYGFDADYCVDCTLTNDTADSREMTLITDTFTSGATLRGMLEKIKASVGNYPSDIVVCVDRMEKTDHSVLSAKHETENRCGVKIHSIVNADDIIRAVENGVIHAGDFLEKIKAYQELYRGI